MSHATSVIGVSLLAFALCGCSSLERGRFGSSEVSAAPAENRTSHVERVEYYREPNAVEVLDSITALGRTLRR